METLARIGRALRSAVGVVPDDPPRTGHMSFDEAVALADRIAKERPFSDPTTRSVRTDEGTAYVVLVENETVTSEDEWPEVERRLAAWDRAL